jgi:hypothetical protein
VAEEDRIGGLPRWPAAAGELPGGEPPSPQLHWSRGVVAVIAYALASAGYMAAFITPNTSWEHHPFAGPLVAVYHSRHPAELALSLAIWAGLGIGLCWPAFRLSGLAIVFSVASVAAWVALGVWAAATASC